MKCSHGISNFLEEISSLSHSVVSSISLHWSLKKWFCLLTILWNFVFKWVYISFSPLPFASLLFSTIFKASSDNHFVFLHFFFLGMVLIPASCTVSWTSVHSSSGTLSDLIPWIYLSLPLYNYEGFDLSHSGFPYFVHFKSEFCNMEFMIWDTVSSQSCFCQLYRPSPSSAAWRRQWQTTKVFLPWEPPWIVWKAKKIWHWKMNSLGR